MDSTQFTQQLVQFSQVEQQIKTNSEPRRPGHRSFRRRPRARPSPISGKDALIQSDTAASRAARLDLGLLAANDRRHRDAGSARRLQPHRRDAQTARRPPAITSSPGTARTRTATSCRPATIISSSPPRTRAARPSRQRSPRSAVIRGVDFSGTTPQIITDSGSHDFSTIRAVRRRVTSGQRAGQNAGVVTRRSAPSNRGQFASRARARRDGAGTCRFIPPCARAFPALRPTQARSP